MAADLTNTELFTFLEETVLARLSSIDMRLATINGTVAQHVKDIAANATRAAALAKQQQDNCIQIARLQERDAHQKERLVETSGAVKDVVAKVWDNAMNIAALTATAAFITKLAGLW